MKLRYEMISGKITNDQFEDMFTMSLDLPMGHLGHYKIEFDYSGEDGLWTVRLNTTNEWHGSVVTIWSDKFHGRTNTQRHIEMAKHQALLGISEFLQNSVDFLENVETDIGKVKLMWYHTAEIEDNNDNIPF